MFVVNVGLDAYTGTPILLLTDAEKRRLLPIWIGIHEAGAIQRAQYGIKSPRPMTHDLLLDVIGETGHIVDHVEITGLDDGRYLAALVLSPRERSELKASVVLDARPSDAVAIALLSNAAIYVSLPVVAEATVPAEPEREKTESEEFKQFVAGLNASDFKLQGRRESGSGE